VPDVVLLAAGQGSRLRPLTHDRPKSMLVAAGQPVLHHLLTDLAALGVQDVVLVTGHGHEQLQSFVGDGTRFGLSVRYVRQAKQLGPGHALLQARPQVRSQEFVVLPVDAWYAPEVLAHLLDNEGCALLQVDDSRSGRHGVPVVRGEEVLDLEPAGSEGGRASGGAYRLHQRIFEALERHEFRLRESVRNDIQRHGGWRAIAVPPRAYLDIIEVRDLLDLHSRLLEAVLPDIEGTVDEGAIVTGQVRIGKGSRIRAGTIIEGPAVIGEHCDIGPGAILEGGTAVRNHVRVQPFTLLSRCIVGSNVEVGSHVRIQRAYVDRGTVIGSGVHIAGGSGSIVGADARLGDDAKVSPDGVVGRGATVAPGRTVSHVPDGGMAV